MSRIINIYLPEKNKGYSGTSAPALAKITGLSRNTILNGSKHSHDMLGAKILGRTYELWVTDELVKGRQRGRFGY